MIIYLIDKIKKLANFMSDYLYKIDTFLKKDLFKIKNPQIVEFGVREGRSTKLFLDLCDQNDGKLFFSGH